MFFSSVSTIIKLSILTIPFLKSKTTLASYINTVPKIMFD